MHSDYVGPRSSKALSNVCCRDSEVWLPWPNWDWWTPI